PMTSDDAIEAISAWFSLAGVAGLVLPDGWFGRPYDAQHRLTYLGARPHKVLLELDDQLLLVFTHVGTVRRDASRLVLAGFAQLVFDWLEYGSLVPHVTVYPQGQVELVPPIGTRIT